MAKISKENPAKCENNNLGLVHAAVDRLKKLCAPYICESIDLIKINFKLMFILQKLIVPLRRHFEEVPVK